MSRPTRTGCIAMHVECQGCDWTYDNHKNGLALAALHHDRTGHLVYVDIYNMVIYGEKKEKKDGGKKGSHREV